MRRLRLLSLVLAIACLGSNISPQSIAAQDFSAFRVPAPAGLPICPLHVMQLDTVMYPFQYGMPCGMASLATTPEALEAMALDRISQNYDESCFGEFDRSLNAASDRPVSPAPAMPMAEFEDQTPACDTALIEDLMRKTVDGTRRSLILLTPEHMATIIDSHLQMVADFAKTGFAPEFCYGPAPQLTKPATPVASAATVSQPATGATVVEEPFTDRSLANHSLIIHVIPEEEEVVESVRQMLPFTLQFSPFATGPIVTGCLSQLAADPRVMLTQEEALARDYVFHEGDLFAEDGYYDEFDCVWAGIQGAVCGKVNNLYDTACNTHRWPTTAMLQTAAASKQGLTANAKWNGSEAAASLGRKQGDHSLKTFEALETTPEQRAAAFTTAAAELLKRLGSAMTDLGEKIEVLEAGDQPATAGEEVEANQQASLDAMLEAAVKVTQPYFGL